MNEKDPVTDAVPVEPDTKIPPVEDSEVSPVEESKLDPEYQGNDTGLIPADKLVPATEDLAHEIAHRLDDLLAGKFEPIDCTRTVTVDLGEFNAVIEVRVMLRNK